MGPLSPRIWSAPRSPNPALSPLMKIGKSPPLPVRPPSSQEPGCRVKGGNSGRPALRSAEGRLGEAPGQPHATQLTGPPPPASGCCQHCLLAPESCSVKASTSQNCSPVLPASPVRPRFCAWSGPSVPVRAPWPLALRVKDTPTSGSSRFSEGPQGLDRVS